MKNGEASYRKYQIHLADAQVLGWMADTVESVEYKLGAYPVLTYGEEENCVGLLLDYAYADERLALSPEQVQRFMDTYQRDLRNLKLDEILNEVAVARLGLAFRKAETSGIQGLNPNSYGEYVAVEETKASVYGVDNGFYYDFEESGYRIYPSFTQTLALLEEFGAKVADEIPVEDIKTITVCDYNREWQGEDGVYHHEVILEYTPEGDGTDKIETLLENIVPNRMSSNLYNRVHAEENIDVNINYNYNGMDDYVSAQFKKGQIPAFVLEEIEQAAQ